jgi:hypothetical protein
MEVPPWDLARDALVVDRVVLFLAGGILFALWEVLEDIGEPSGAPTTYQFSIKCQRSQSLIESRGISCAPTAFLLYRSSQPTAARCFLCLDNFKKLAAQALPGFCLTPWNEPFELSGLNPSA